MIIDGERIGEELSPQGLETLLRLLVTGRRARVSSAIVDGRTVWIKRLGLGGGGLGKWLHAALTPVIPLRFFRSSRRLDGAGKAEREIRKTNAFRAAGFPAVAILFHRDDVLVSSNAGRIVVDELAALKQSDPAAHDALLVDCAEVLGRAHAAGLAHGRPHPRDMFIEDGRIGFLDFEEEPENVMPLADAQARDVWLLFLQIVARAVEPDAPRLAFAKWCALAPSDAMGELHRLVAFAGAVLPIMRAAGPLLGADGRRVVGGTEFLRMALAAPRANDTSMPAVAGARKDRP